MANLDWRLGSWVNLCESMTLRLVHTLRSEIVELAGQLAGTSPIGAVRRGILSLLRHN